MILADVAYKRWSWMTWHRIAFALGKTNFSSVVAAFVVGHDPGKGILHLTYWGQDKMAAISQTTFSNAFSWMKMYEFRLRFHLSLFLRFESTIFHQIMAWCRPGDKPLSEPMMVSLLTHIYASLSLNELTFLVLRPRYSGRTRSILWLLMPWLLASPGHQQPRYWRWRIKGSLNSPRKNAITMSVNSLRPRDACSRQ